MKEQRDGNIVKYHYGSKSAQFKFVEEKENRTSPVSPLLDSGHGNGEKIAALILSRLGLNERLFARNCSYVAIDKNTANRFLDDYHLLNSTNAAFNRGLLYEGRLVALASFSKGRKMHRLPESQRSFELIRFCCRSGITVSGGLSKLVRNFCREKDGGDIMTYVDRRLSEGQSFAVAGFIKQDNVPGTTAEKNKRDTSSVKMIFSCNRQNTVSKSRR